MRRGLAVALSAAVVMVGSVTTAQALPADVPADPNPVLPAQCDMDLAISLDLSNSVAAAQLDQTRTELTALAADLEGYPVRIALHNFASNAPATGAASNAPLPLTALDAAGVATIADYIAGVARPASASGGTNWDRAFAAVTDSAEAYDALLLVTDGNPTQYGSPAQGPGSSTDLATIDAAVTSANGLKSEGTRVIGIGIGDNLSGPGLTEFRENMSQVSGPAEGSDYFVADFSTLRATLVELVNQNCASVTLDKTATLSDGAHGYEGDVVEYAFTVTNEGSVPLSDVAVTDALPGLSAIVFDGWPGAAGVLEAGQSVTGRATYTLTAADAERGLVDNVATVSATPPAGDPVTDEDEETLTYGPAPALSLEKTGTLADGAAAGEVVSYRFTVTNTGNVPLTDVTLRDPLVGLSAISYGPWPGAPGTLAPGQSVTASATYVLTQADVDSGAIDNVASVTGTPPQGDPVGDEDGVTVPLAPAAAIALVKTGALAPGATGVAGDTVQFAFTVTNTGDVTLGDVVVVDELEGLSEVTFGAWPGAAGVLAPGQSVTASATYSLTQADVDARKVDNAAVATGTTPGGDPVDDAAEVTVPVDAVEVTVPVEEVDVPLASAPAIDLVKKGALVPGATGLVGETVSYTFTVTNAGDVPLTDVTVTDRLPGLSALTFQTWPGATGELAPGQSVTATATYVLTQADVDAGKVDNTATATGLSPDGDVVDDVDTATVSTTQLAMTGLSATTVGILGGAALLVTLGAAAIVARRRLV